MPTVTTTYVIGNGSNGAGANQIVSETTGGVTTDYAYDGNGNRSSRTVGGAGKGDGHGAEDGSSWAKFKAAGTCPRFRAAKASTRTKAWRRPQTLICLEGGQMKIYTLILFSVVIYAQAVAQEINPGDVFTSPDGCFTVRFTDREMNLDIRDNQTGKVTILGVLTPCYSIKWTGDSKTIVAIYHLAGGSDADIFHFTKSEWRRCSVASPNDNFNFIDVIEEKIGMNRVSLTYKAGIRGPQRDAFFTYSLNFNPETGATTGMVEHEIDKAIYEKLQAVGKN
jgi:YD repeat-containing protein